MKKGYYQIRGIRANNNMRQELITSNIASKKEAIKNAKLLELRYNCYNCKVEYVRF